MSLVTVCVVFCMTCWSHSLSCVLQLWHDMSFALFVLCYSYGMIVALFVLCYSNVMTIALFVLTCAAAVTTRHLRVALCPVLHLSYDMTCLSRSFFLYYSYDKVTGASSVRGVCATCQSPLRLSCVNCGVVKSESSAEGTAEGSEVSALGDSGIDKDGKMLMVTNTHL